LFAALYREIIIRRPEDFKIACLKSIKGLFLEKNPFVSGFGNKITDVITYKAVEIPLSKIFTINHRGEVHLELTRTLSSTYLTRNSFVDAIFPVVKDKNKHASDSSFKDFQYWKHNKGENQESEVSDIEEGAD
jgi:phosphatidate phosphatase LPIN